jgi:glycosyltransferase involved in cell wall biosynthesis
VVADFAAFTRLVERGVTFTPPRGDRERVVVESSDLILPHSPHVRFAFEQFFPGHMGKVYANDLSIADLCYREAEAFSALARPFAQRDIDVLFVASDWERPEKNYPLVQKLAASCRNLRLHLVGAAPTDGLPLHRHGVIADRRALYALLGRSRALVCPSHFDAAPGVLFEASAMGCNVVASPNCGNWQLVPEPLLARSPAAFDACIRRAAAAPYADHRQRFGGGYAELVETLQAFV